MQQGSLLLFSCLASLSFIASGMAFWSCVRVTRLLRTHSARSALEISSELAALQTSLQSLSTTVRRLSSREGMAARRGADGKAQKPEPTTADVVEMQRRVAAKMFSGGKAE